MKKPQFKIYWNKKKSRWQLVIRRGNKSFWGGLYPDLSSARIARNQFLRQFHGPFALLIEWSKSRTRTKSTKPKEKPKQPEEKPKSSPPSIEEILRRERC